MAYKKAPAAKTTKTARAAMASGIVIPPNSAIGMASTNPPAVDAMLATSAQSMLDQAAASAQPGQEPDLPPPPPPADPAPDAQPEQAQNPEPGPDAVPYAAIYDLADARALPDVTEGVYALASFESPQAIRAFKDHDGRSMAVVWTGYTLAKTAIND